MSQSVFIGGPLDGVYMLEPPLRDMPGMFAAFEPGMKTWNRYVRSDAGGTLDIMPIEFLPVSEVRVDPYTAHEVIEFMWEGVMPPGEVPVRKKRRKP